MSRLLAIDPGTTESGWCVLEGRAVEASGVFANDEILDELEAYADGRTHLAIEMIASYGMPVGREVFETCVWIGRFSERWYSRTEHLPALVYRQQVKLHLCGSARAKDANIRQALLDLIGPQGTKKAPGPTYGVKSHAWAALAVGATHLNLRTDASGG
jgi:Holliday junction resolvasome RuvABC endonuclease subunit